MLASGSFWKKAAAFVLTFLGYASLHSLREGWSYSKQQLEAQFDLGSDFLGIVDALYLISYSFGMAALGSIIHRVSLKIYIIAGLLLASASYVLFPIIFATTGYFSPALMAVLMCLNGFFQATGWPGMMGIFGNWFQKNKKGVLMGIWAMNANVGNIVASSICNMLEEHQISWVWNFAVTGGFAVAVAILMLFLLKEAPEENQHTES
jgi:sugar phosphate permease